MENNSGKFAENEENFDWLQLHNDMAKVQVPETAGEKMMRKIKENPLVPIGCAATVTALSVGLWSFRTGRSRLSQQMMRARIAAQGFTVAALIIGVMAAAKKSFADRQNAPTPNP